MKKQYIAPAAAALHLQATEGLLAGSDRESLPINSETSGSEQLSDKQGWSSEGWE